MYEGRKMKLERRIKIPTVASQQAAVQLLNHQNRPSRPDCDDVGPALLDGV